MIEAEPQPPRSDGEASRGCLAGLATLLLLLSGVTSFAHADDMDDMDDVFGGFEEEDEAFAVDEEAPEETVDRWWDINGDIGVSTSYNYRGHRASFGPDSGLSCLVDCGTWYGNVQKLRTKLRLQGDAELFWNMKARVSGYVFYDFAYLIHGRSNYTDEVLDLYEWDAQLTDTYLEGPFFHENVDFKFGRQVVNWGRSETLRVLDIINPLDNREPGIADIEDLRLAVTMARFGIFAGPWSLTTLIIPEYRNDFLPVIGNDFFPGTPTSGVSLEEAQLLQAIAFIGGSLPEDSPDGWDSENVQVAANLTGIFSGWDVSFQAAWYWDVNPHVNRNNLQLEHARLWMAGSGANYTWRSWLVKAEIAYVGDLEYTWASEEKNRLDVMGGIEYYGISDLNIVFEVANRHVFDWEPEMSQIFDEVEENRVEYSLRVTWDVFNQRLQLTALGSAFGAGAQFGSLIRLSANYDLMDALEVEGGIVIYLEGDDLFFERIGRNDRLFMGIKYSF